MGIEHSPKGLLIDQRLRDRLDGDGLREVITTLRGDGHSWRQCARKVSEWSGVRVSYQTVADLAYELDVEDAEPAGDAA